MHFKVVDYYKLSSEEQELHRAIEDAGYTVIIEWKPKEDWPKEDDHAKEARYVVSAFKMGKFEVATRPTIAQALEDLKLKTLM